MTGREDDLSDRRGNEASGLLDRLRRLPVLSVLFCMLAMLLIGGASIHKLQAEPGIITSYGYAVFGELKYPANFKHLDYVNPDAPKGGTYRYAQSGTFDSFNYFGLVGSPPFALLWVYDPLMQRSLDEPASYYPLIARSITYPRDLSWVEFELDPRARWHDGKPITPEDVMFTVEKFKTMVPPMYRRIGMAVSKTEKIGPHRVRLHLVNKGNPTTPAALAAMPVLPRHVLEGKDMTVATLELPMGSGPVRISRFSAGRWLELERVKNYWAADLPINKGRWNFDTVRHDFYRDAAVLNEVFLSGQTDLRFEVSAMRWGDQDRSPAFRSGDIVRDNVPYDNGAFYMGLTLNARNPVLADRRVRKALMQVYDYEWIKRVLLAGHHGRLHSFFANTEFAAEGMPSADELKLLEPFRGTLPPELFDKPPELPVGGNWSNRRKNILEATDLLREAGYRIENGLLVDPRTHKPVSFSLVAYSPLIDRSVSLFMENLKSLGISVDFRSYDSAQFRNRVGAYDYDMVVGMPSFPPLPTPGLEMQQFWSSQAADTPKSLNYAGVKDPAVDAMLKALGGAQDRATVVASMRAVDRILLWNFYAIPFQHTYPAPLGRVPLSYWNRFGRPAKDPTYNFPFLTMEHWWIDPQKEAKLSHGAYGH